MFLLIFCFFNDRSCLLNSYQYLSNMRMDVIIIFHMMRQKKYNIHIHFAPQKKYLFLIKKCIKVSQIFLTSFPYLVYPAVNGIHTITRYKENQTNDRILSLFSTYFFICFNLIQSGNTHL